MNRIAAETTACAATHCEAGGRDAHILNGELLEALPIGVYVCDADGVVTSFNERAVELWGRRPECGDHAARYCGSLRLFHLDGRPMPHEQCPMAEVLRTQEPQQNREVMVERPDGSRAVVLVNLTPLFDGAGRGAGRFIGAMNCFQDITDLKRTEATLRRSERNLADFFDNATLGLHWVNADGIIIRANRAELEMLGYTEHEYVGRHIAEFHADRPMIEDILARLKRGETLRECPARLRRKDGSIRHVLINSSALFEDGRFIHTRCFTRDVTEQRETEDELARQFAQLDAIYAGAPIGLAFADTDLRYVRVNAAMAELNGCPIEEHIGRTGREVIGEQVAPIEELLRRVIKTGVPVANIELQYETPSQPGVQRDWLASYSSVSDGSGRCIGVSSIVQEITGRKRAEEALRRKAEEVQTLLETLPVGVFFAFDPECRVITGNRAGNELLRMPPLSNLSKTAPTGEAPSHFRVCRNGVELPHHELPVQRAARGEYVRSEEVEQVFDDGTIVHTLMSATPLFDDHGQVRGAVATVQDITERKRAEELLRRRLSQLRVLYDLSDAVGRADAVEDVCDAALDGLLQALSADRAAILLCDDAGVMRFKAWRGLSDGYRAAVAGHSPWQPGDSDPQPVFIEDAEHVDLGPLRDVVLGEGIRSLGFFPLVQQGRLLGKFMVYFDRPRTLSESETRLAKAIAGHIAVAIERRGVEEALREREQRYKLVVAGAEAAIWDWDVSAKRVLFSPRWKQLRGLADEEVSDSEEEWSKGIHPDDHDRVMAAVRAHFDGRTPVFAEEYRIRHKDGHWVWILDRGIARRDASGTVIRMAGSETDITARKSAEEELRRSEREFRTLAEHTPDVIVRFDRELRHLYINPAIEAATGRRPEEFIGRTKRELGMAPEHCDRWEAICRAAFETGRAQEMEFEYPSPDGPRHFIACVMPEFGDDGEVQTALAVTRDITARKRAEEHLREAERRLRQLADTMPQIVWSCRGDGSVEYMNRRWYEFTGIEEGRLDEKSWIEAIHPDERDDVVEVVRRSTESGEPFDVEFRLRNGTTGEYRWHLARRVPLRDENGRVTRWFGSSTDIHNYKLAQEAKGRLAAIVESSEDAIVSETLDGVITSWNAGAERLFGYTAAEAVGQPILMLIPTEREDEERMILVRLGRGERIAQYETVRLTKDGRLIDVSLSVAPIRDEHGRVVGASKLAQDITARKRAEDALRLSELRYRSLVEQAPVVIQVFGPDGTVLRTNAAWEKLWNVSRTELEGYNILQDRQLVRKGVMPYIRRAFAGHAVTIPPIHYDPAEIGKPGRGRWTDASVYPVTDEHGRVCEVVLMLRDVTEHKLAEQALRDSEERLRIALAAGRMGAWQWEVATGRVIWSPVLEDIHGIPRGSFGCTLEDFRRDIHPEDRVRVLAAIDKAVRSGTDLHVEYRIIRPDGQMRWVEGHGRLFRDQSGRDAGTAGRMVGVCMDITERKRSEEELARHRDRLQELVEERTAELERSHEHLRHSERMAALGTLSTGLGHDMGNLLLPLRLRVDSIEQKIGGAHLDARERVGLREDLTAVRRCAEYMQRLTSGLRLFSLDPNDTRGSDAATELDSWWPEVEPFLRNVLSADITLEHRPFEGLPPVRIAKHMLTQAVFNLVQNSGEALRGHGGGQGGGRVRVWAEAMDDSFIRISVTDDGPGMTPEVAQRCLEPFFTTKSRGLSTGLGLALVHGIMQKCGGSIGIETEVGGGTSIELRLPVCKAGSHQDHGRTMIAAVHVHDERLGVFIESALRSLGVDASRRALAAEIDLLVSDDVSLVRAATNGDAPRPQVVALGSDFADGAMGGVFVVEEPRRRANLLRMLQKVVEERSKDRTMYEEITE